MNRLFIALNIPDEIKENIFYHIEKVVPDFNTFRWEKPHKVHLTLKFIGNFDEKHLPELKSDLDFISDFEQYKCSLGGFNFFYRNKKPAIFFLDLITDKDISLLANRLNDTLKKFNVPVETKDFKTHLTLLRLKGHEDISSLIQLKNSGIPNQEFFAGDVVLYKSTLNPSGSVYTALNIYKLKRSIL